MREDQELLAGYEETNGCTICKIPSPEFLSNLRNGAMGLADDVSQIASSPPLPRRAFPQPIALRGPHNEAVVVSPCMFAPIPLYRPKRKIHCAREGSPPRNPGVILRFLNQH